MQADEICPFCNEKVDKKPKLRHETYGDCNVCKKYLVISKKCPIKGCNRIVNCDIELSEGPYGKCSHCKNWIETENPIHLVKELVDKQREEVEKLSKEIQQESIKEMRNLTEGIKKFFGL